MSSTEKFIREGEEIDEKYKFVPPLLEEEGKIIGSLKTVTDIYLSSWGSLELEGNEGIKEKIRENILRVEKYNNDKKYKNWAEKFGISVPELKKQLQDKVEFMVDKADFFRATSMAVISDVMINDGRWKSQFETGTSNGSLDPGYRSEVESIMFGIPNDKVWNKRSRPIYGYFTDGRNGEISYTGEIPPPSNLSNYGVINVKIKREVAMKRSTITFSDSLYKSDYMTPTPASRPHFTSFYGLGSEPLSEVNSSKKTNWGSGYTEVQFHGGLTMEDVESIHISENNGMTPEDMQKVRDLFDKYKELHPESQIKLIEY
ncbi:MAG: DUF3626 domain-containing protein [Candidatus Vogelbacteria bacterium]|nr:DUF3626 domain-containing protein [Candidatus Vogelbacteria bacterium]